MKDYSLFDILDKKINENITYNSTEYKNQLEQIKKMFDIQNYILFECAKIIEIEPYLNEDDFTTLVKTALVKNMYSISSAIRLTIDGLVGSARIIMRNVFEFLLIAKYASISNDSTFITKWENGEEISLSRQIFRNITYPKSDEIKRFWNMLCRYTHGTVYSQQIEIDSKDIKNDIKLNLLFIRMLLEMNYHVLNSHFTNDSISYYTNFYITNYSGEDSKIKVFKLYKDELRTLFKESKSTMEKEPRKVIYDFKLKWELK